MRSSAPTEMVYTLHLLIFRLHWIDLELDQQLHESLQLDVVCLFQMKKCTTENIFTYKGFRVGDKKNKGEV
jgi:hypothetical protein